jgi:(2R)-3-sulfolactate dehydrogenase (NADP+)
MLASDALVAANTSAYNAQSVATALVAADAEGLSSHGVSRVPFYADQAKSGKVDGQAVPETTTVATTCVRVDAKCGFAFPAIRAGLEGGLELAREHGTAAIAVTDSHHCGALGYHVEHVGEAGLIALGFSNTPAGMAPWGGTRATFGTNPIAFASPRTAGPALVIDLSLSHVARGKIMLAQKSGEAIPEGWALDGDGNATTDPTAALSGTMVPAGGAKGAALALMVETLAAAVTGASFSYEASSFFTAEGPSPSIGQFFVLVDQTRFNPGYAERFEALATAICAQEGVRLPGDRRHERRLAARQAGVSIPDALYEDLRARAG